MPIVEDKLHQNTWLIWSYMWNKVSHMYRDSFLIVIQVRLWLYIPACPMASFLLL